MSHYRDDSQLIRSNDRVSRTSTDSAEARSYSSHTMYTQVSQSRLLPGVGGGHETPANVVLAGLTLWPGRMYVE